MCGRSSYNWGQHYTSWEDTQHYLPCYYKYLYSFQMFRIRYVSSLNNYSNDTFKIVSPSTILEVQFSCHVRICNPLGHFTAGLVIPATIGVQGTNELSCQCRPVDNLYLCRPFACPDLCYFPSQKTRFSCSWVSWRLHRYTKPGPFSCQCHVGAYVTGTYTSH